ncbi:MAG: MFS transporter [bacterium]|nr:MFS transporter [bacterium]
MSVTAPSRRLIKVVFLIFVTLGLSAGVLGVAWPSIRVDLSRPVSDLGLLLAIGTGGYFVAGLFAGRLTSALGIGNLLSATLLLGTVSLMGYGLAQSWPMLLMAAIGLGFTGGLVDAVINAYVALHHGTRTMNLLHASFGLGATTGPILVASLLARGLSWRWTYLVLAIAEAALLAVVFVLRRYWPDPPEEKTVAVSDGRVGGSIAGVLGLFLLNVGFEITAGQFAYSVLTEGRNVAEFAAGIWVALYWGGLTGGRLLLGVIGDRITGRSILHLSMAGSVIGAIVFWRDPSGLGVLSLPLLGLSIAGVFPTLVALTPLWVGADRAPAIIGYQVAAASVGTAAVPWIASGFIDANGLEALGPFLVVTAVLMALLHLVVDRHAYSNGQWRSAQSRSPFSRQTNAKNSSQS